MNSWQQPVSGEPSAGTLHLIPDSSRPSAWVLNGGTATSYTDVDFSAYVPNGVKALLLKASFIWTGDGAQDGAYFTLRKNGSSETATGRLVVIYQYYTNLAAGVTFTRYEQVICECDKTGIIEYMSNRNPAVGALYLNILGYYI
jgi:hypothetical protein